MDQAEKYSDLALKSDRYNARAYVNKVCVCSGSGGEGPARCLLR